MQRPRARVQLLAGAVELYRQVSNRRFPKRPKGLSEISGAVSAASPLADSGYEGRSAAVQPAFDPVPLVSSPAGSGRN